jgi:hypothetical protein
LQQRQGRWPAQATFDTKPRMASRETAESVSPQATFDTGPRMAAPETAESVSPGVEQWPVDAGCAEAPNGRAHTQSAPPSGGPQQALRLLCLFHLNLAFSSLEEESHDDVIRRCYWPALELARDTGFPVALEVTGWTLERIAQLDPGWIELLRELLCEGCVELVGSAHAQCAAPLLPAEVNLWNLRLGRQVYGELLGVAPRIALVCEQVYSPGLVGLYLQAGYEALIVDWDNARRSHPQWPDEYRLHPQRARGAGRSIPLVWSKSIAFQKFQRYAHGELSLERYVEYVRGVAHGERDADADANADSDAGLSRAPGRALMLYANDVEIFDHRPGRFAAEPDLEENEWGRIATGLRTLREDGVGRPTLPAELLDLLNGPGAGHELRLEAPAQPIPVKKQDKYNVSRWAVTGRDDIGINTRCWRVFERLRSTDCVDPDRWRELCELWASDYRTHITQARWDSYLARLEEVERRWQPIRPVDSDGILAGLTFTGGIAPDGTSPGEAVPCGTVPGGTLVGVPGETLRGEAVSGGTLVGVTSSGVTLAGEGPFYGSSGDVIELRAGTIALRLNARRGLAIESFADTRVAERPLFGTLEHGYYPTIELGADFYSGHLVQESPLTHKVTDLERVRPTVGRDAHGRTCALATIPTERGPIEKAIRLDPSAGTVEIEWSLHWEELPLGSLRLGHVTMLPEAFDAQTLWYATHNGGAELETHPIAGAAFDHGAAVSALVSCRQGLGATEGVVLLGDAHSTVRVEIDRAIALPLGLITWIPGDQRWFLRLAFTLTESDETRRGGIPRTAEDPQRMRMRISAERTTS